MKHIVLLIIFIGGLICHPTFAQDSKKLYNLDLESSGEGAPLPDEWFKWGSPTYEVSQDTEHPHGGLRSAYVAQGENAVEKDFGCAATSIKANFLGSEIRLEAYMKLQDVENGHAGLLMRLDGNGQFLEFSNMKKDGIHGTIEWKKYSITLPYKADEIDKIYVGGILTGSGKAWFDDFKLFIDDIPIEKAKPAVTYLATDDHEFDEGSGIKFVELSDDQLINFYKLGKIWGLLKYYHPTIAAGKLNWDYELFRFLKKSKSIDDKTIFEDALVTWIVGLGEFDIKNKKEEQLEVEHKASTDWIYDETFIGGKLRAELDKVLRRKTPVKHYYVELAPGVGNPNFIHEDAYPKMEVNDDGMRLLSVYRFWNMIEYYFPYKHLIDDDWSSVLEAFVPQVLNANDDLSYRLVLLELIGKIKDTHANIWGRDDHLNAYWGENIAPLRVSFIGNQLVVTELMDGVNSAVDLQVGDVITHVNGEAVTDIVERNISLFPASNQPTRLRNIARKILRTSESKIGLAIQRNDLKNIQQIDCQSTRDVNFYAQNQIAHEILDNNIGYLYPGTLERGEIDEIMKGFSSTDGLIIDLRCYPSDFIVFSAGKYLMPEPTPFVKFTIGSLETPGEFAFRGSGPIQVGEENKEYYKGKIVILINETTQSQAEYTTMALSVAPNVTVVGSTTAGADGNVSKIMLPGNIRTMLSGIGVYYPDGRETQRIGIVPDIELHPTIEGVQAGRDELLEKAVELILNH